ncbi:MULTISPECIES: sulfite exporter TauE/SafE family protein [unclassified Luteococcus]|uniref:sulfite exporter TauE/SafE family protein n=1 Tax=unclassified Luteococcus TaxID=2639923 RepID=UPI00313A7B68
MILATHVLIGLMLAAFIAGWVDAVVGGGGLIQLPALLIGLPADTSVATIAGTNKVPAAAGTLMASLTYLRTVRVDWRSALPLMVTAWLGSTAGANLAHRMPREWFTPLVLVVILVVGGYTVRRPQLGLQQKLRHDGRGHLARLLVIGGGVGVYDGLIGPGTGTFFVIALVSVMGYGFLEASTLTKLANLTTNLAAISVFVLHGSILWPVALCMAAANLTGGLLGARTAVRRGNAFVRKVFLLVISALVMKLAWDTLQLLV